MCVHAVRVKRSGICVTQKSFTNGRFTTKPGDDVRLQYKQETGEEERWRDKDGRVQEALRGEMEESYSVITRLCAGE